MKKNRNSFFKKLLLVLGISLLTGATLVTMTACDPNKSDNKVVEKGF